MYEEYNIMDLKTKEKILNELKRSKEAGDNQILMKNDINVF